MATKELSADMEALVLALPAEKQAHARKVLAKADGGSKRKSIEEIKAGKNGSLVISDEVEWDEAAGKQAVVISCSIEGCENTRRVFTSDLHQVSVCLEDRKAQRSIARKARKEEADLLIAEGKKALAQKAQS
jgi:hypothetical protein